MHWVVDAEHKKVTNPLCYKSCVRCRRLEQRREAPTEREAREVILQRCARIEQRREALTEREAREVILRGIDAH